MDNSWWQQLPPVTRNILLINIIVWAFDSVAQNFGVQIIQWLGLFNWGAGAFHGAWTFHIWQPVTYMFMHQGFWHMFCNMFAVWMFGTEIERRWGSEKYLTYYFVSGLGAALVQELVWMLTNGAAPAVTIGASGAVFGILFAFGWLFPEVKMFLLFVPIPIPSRWFVAGYAIFELFAGIHQTAGDNVAHFAHLGGMLFGWLLILFWKNKSKLRMRTRDKDNNAFNGYHYQPPIDEEK